MTVRWRLSKCAVLVAVLAAACAQQRYVERVTVVNPSVYDVEADVTNGAKDGWLQLGRVRRNSEVSTGEVLDQGAVWIFRFQHLGRDGGELRVTRAELEQKGWRIEVPGAVAERLSEMGFPPSPQTPG